MIKQKVNGKSRPGVTKKDFDLEVRSFFGGVGSYLEGLGQINLPAEARARNPLVNHPWVFASAMVTAIVASQAPFVVWTETDKQQRERRRKERAKGRPVFPKAGKERRAMHRHDIRRVGPRLMHKGIELDETHPLLPLLENPNPFQDAGQLWFMTHMMLAAESEIFWILTDDEGNATTAYPTRIYPMRGEFMTEIFEHGSYGDLIGFRYTPPRWMPGKPGQVVNVPISSILHFKFPNPFNPIRGFSRLTPSAGAIESSLLAKSWNRSTLRNSGVPKGVISYAGMMEPSERGEFLNKWKDKFEGPENQGRIALLSEGFQYQNIALSPADMQWSELNVSDREEVLAVMQMPKTVLGLTDAVNYATSQGQDRNFWDKTVLPMMSLEEKTVDGSLFFMEQDNTFGAFDLSSVESLRVGLESKVKLAHQLSDKNLHMPPAVAYQVVGIEVEDYIGIDVAFVSGLVTPVPDVLEPTPEPEPIPEPVVEPIAGDEPEVITDPEPEPEPEPKALERYTGLDASCSALTRASSNAKVQKAFQKIQKLAEVQFSLRYRQWVAKEKKQTLARFDEFTSEVKAMTKLLFTRAVDINLTQVLPNLQDSQNALKTKIRPLYSATTDEAYDFTLQQIGVPVFQVDDPVIQAYFDERESVYSQSVPDTLAKNLNKSLQKGIEEGESLFQLRMRVQEVYGRAASSGKALTIARTESSSFINGVRDKMFELQGITREDWASAEDEATREDHLSMDSHGIADRGFNWLEVVGKESEGILAYPGDSRAPSNQTINCRCVKIPVE